ncbi:glutamate--cysteine ligase [Microbacterium imperiale]|nr:glutamate--cysteine ligase [Microbacterium imperiale]MBP2419555.1 carboxylate-amine ligase [Microbacterium imperiale]MDS0198578.1 glutamate--cysteine ligase [Microbacterium imperiale]
MTMLHSPELLPTAGGPGGLRTLGIEEEFLLVDATTFRPIPAADETLLVAQRASLSAVGPMGAPIAFHRELKSEQIEVVSPPVRTRSELVAVIAEGRRTVDRAAQAVGARAVPLATCPDACTPHVAPSPRYEKIAARFGATAQEQLTCGMHIHVSVTSPEEGIAVLDRVRAWLPLVLALSANSPFWQGADSGFASYRYQAWGRWPTSGPTEIFGSPDAYRREVAASVGSGVCLDTGMIYFDARLSSHVPTVEIRIADVCLRPEDAVTIPVLVRALVDRAAADWRAGHAPAACSAASIRLASWRASRWALDDELIHPTEQRLVPAAAAVAALLRYVEDHFATPLERSQTHDGVASIIERGNGASLQRTAASSGGGLACVVAESVRHGLGG